MFADAARRPAAPPLDLAPNAELLALIGDEIRRGGPITFARFMELALYAPELGYYTSSRTRIGRGGDFLTAPETHPIFGAAVARHVASVWQRLGRPQEFVVRDYGAGTGALAEAVLGNVAHDVPDLAEALRYEAVEVNPYRREEIADRIPDLHVLAPDEAATPPTATGLVLANEYLDAFAVHLLEWRRGGWQEIHVDLAPSGLVERLAALSEPSLASDLPTSGLADGQRAEVAVGIEAWFKDLAAWLEHGVVTVIDYADEVSNLVGPRRPRGTLVGYLDQRALDDPLAAVGRQDLTAQVDVTRLRHAAAASGFDHLGTTTQAAWLMDLGLEDLLEAARGRDQALGDYLALRSGVVRLLDPRHLGNFAVVVLGRGVAPTPPLPGLRRPGK